MKNKRLRKGLIIVLLFVTVSLALIILPSKLVSRLDSSLSLTSRLNYEIEMIAHRGFSSLYPENTLPAFEAAAREGFDGFELDVHTTKDGQWVVIHNETVDKMTDGEGAVRDMTLEELSRLTVDAGNGIKEHPGLKIPTLEQSLQVCKNKDIVPVIEIKGCDTELLPELKSMLDASGLSAKAVIISFNQEWLRLYRDLDSQIRMQLLTHNVTDETVALCEEYNFGISFNYKNLYKCLGALGDAREKGIELCAWTVDNTIYMDIMVLFGVRSITTNKIV